MKSVDAKLLEIIDVGDVLGEGVLWRESDRTIWWTDIQSRRLHCLNWPGLQHQTFTTPERLCSFGYVEGSDDWLVAAFDCGFALFAPASGEVKWLYRPAELGSGRRLNDGRVDPFGNFWAGSMIESGNADKSQTGLYRLDGEGKVSFVLSGLQISNGINWSHDGSVMYYADSPTQTIYRAPCRDRGARLGDATLFATLAHGSPDGAAVADDGSYLTAVWGAGRLVQFAPDGQERLCIELPAPQVTCPVFGGDDMSIILVSSALEGLTEPQLSAAPASGALLIFEAPDGIRGRPATRFRAGAAIGLPVG